MKRRALITSIIFLALWFAGDTLLGGGIDWGWLAIGLLIAIVIFAAVASIQDVDRF